MPSHVMHLPIDCPGYSLLPLERYRDRQEYNYFVVVGGGEFDHGVVHLGEALLCIVISVCTFSQSNEPSSWAFPRPEWG